MSEEKKVSRSAIEVAKHLEEKAKKRGKAESSKEAAEVIQLPLWSSLERALPNHLARSSLFAPIARGRRKIYDRERLSSRDDVAIFFSGKQLDMADQDVFLQALQETQRASLGERAYINRAQFLRTIGRRERGKASYIWLHEAFRRLTLAYIEIETRRYKLGMHLVNDWELDEETGEYWLSISPKIITLFSRNEFGLIDFDKRKQLAKRVDLAKWLQSYIASHRRGEHRIALKHLKSWSGVGGRMRDFKGSLGEALGELERVGLIKSIRIKTNAQGEEQAVWARF